MTDFNLNSTGTSAPPAAATDAPQIGADEKPAWERCPDEKARAYDLAWKYFTMGPARSIEKLRAKLRKEAIENGNEKAIITARQLKRLSHKWQWPSRAEAYDRWIEGTNLEAAERLTVQNAEKWQQREEDRRERFFSMTERMLDRMQAILEYPLAQVTKTTRMDANGRATEITIVQPAKWTLNSAASLAQAVRTLHTAIWSGVAKETDVNEIDIFDDRVPYRGKDR